MYVHTRTVRVQYVQYEYSMYSTSTVCTLRVQYVQYEYSMYITSTVCTLRVQYVQYEYSMYSTRVRNKIQFVRVKRRAALHSLPDLVGSLEVGAVIGEAVLHHHVVARPAILSVDDCSKGYTCTTVAVSTALTVYCNTCI
jgi:hypothetical protein